MGFRDHLPERDGLLSALLVPGSGRGLRRHPRRAPAGPGSRGGCRAPTGGVTTPFPRTGARPRRRAGRGPRTGSASGRSRGARRWTGGSTWLGDGAWVLIRASGTEPVLRVYVEAETAVEVDRLHAAAEALVGRHRRDEPGEPAVSDLDRIRNFSIIAHIDHGKSTLADRLLELTGTMDPAQGRRPGARLDGPRARARDHDQGPHGASSLPGARRPDLHAEPHRHAGARRLLVRGVPEPRRVRGRHPGRRRRAGVEAQTLANFYLAFDSNLTLVPVLNKIDLPQADIDGATQQLVDLLGFGPDEPISISAKSGTGVADVLEADRPPHPGPVGIRRRRSRRSCSTPSTTPTRGS